MASDHSQTISTSKTFSQPLYPQAPFDKPPTMFARTVVRAAPKAPSVIARRGFHATRAQQVSPYHYPEGPLSNIPFNPKSKWFGPGYWAFMGAGFGIPFAIAAWKQSKSAEE